MQPIRQAAIYARISSDQEGSGLGIARQLEDCRRLAGSLGWTVAEEYVDNDISAYSGKQRPAYSQMLEDIADGMRDGVIVYHLDRLNRKPIELERFLEVLTRASVQQLRFVSGGDLDLGTGDGLMVLRILCSVAANESATKSRRVKRKMIQVAESGRPHGGSRRPFGYRADKVTILPEEASTIVTLVSRFLAGESLRSLCKWLEEQQIRTVAGGTWHTHTLRQMITNPRIAGLRAHLGQVVGPAVWEPIITESERQQVIAMLEEARVTGRRTARSYLLSGLVRCGRCGTRLYASHHNNRARRYVCMSGPDHGGCGRMTVVAEPLEELITEAVLLRLDTPQLADALAGRAVADAQAGAIAESLTADRAQLEELAGLYAARQISVPEWIAARNPIEARVKQAERRLSKLTKSTALNGYVGNGSALRTEWPTLNLTRQNAIVQALIDHTIIDPGTPGARSLDPERVRPIWRL